MNERDASFYDSFIFDRGREVPESIVLFGNANIGEENLTNLLVPSGTLKGNASFLCERQQLFMVTPLVPGVDREAPRLDINLGVGEIKSCPLSLQAEESSLDVTVFASDATFRSDEGTPFSVKVSLGGFWRRHLRLYGGRARVSIDGKQMWS